jgi:hypothetical protein
MGRKALTVWLVVLERGRGELLLSTLLFMLESLTIEYLAPRAGFPGAKNPTPHASMGHVHALLGHLPLMPRFAELVAAIPRRGLQPGVVEQVRVVPRRGAKTGRAV